MFRVGSQEAQAGELIDRGILEQRKFWVRDTFAGHHLHIYLHPLSWIGHLLVRLGLICVFLLCRREQTQPAHYPEQTLRTAGVAALPQPVPQLYHAQVGVAAAHIPDQFQLRLCVLVGMAVGPPGLTGQGLCRAVPASLPEINVGPALVVLPAGTDDAVFLRIFHQGLPIRHVLCYTFAHEGYGPLSLRCCPQLQL